MPEINITSVPTSEEINVARVQLSAFILQSANQTAGDGGFDWAPQPVAPSTYSELRAAYELSETIGCPLPVSNQNCADTIYTSPRVNEALRFWHDVGHIRNGLTFDLVDELELSLYLLDDLEAAGYKRGGLVWQLLHADMTGPAYVQSFAKQFPLDQRRFVTGCVQSGFDHGLLSELRLQS